MPLYVYHCDDGHETEQWAVRVTDGKSEIECKVCGKKAMRGIGLPSFQLSWNRTMPDTVKNNWEGTPLEDGSELLDKYKFKKHGPKPRVDLGTEGD